MNEDLVRMIEDHTHWCQSRVWINSGYSRPFGLLRGVRQGDLLSCLLYVFSLEPLGLRLQNKIHGISVLNLPPAKLMMYADDTNLFLSTKKDSLEDITNCLANTSYTIGYKFNLDKTDILPMGTPCHKQLAHTTGMGLPRAYVLAPGSALWVLGIWISCKAQASPRWAQIATHMKKLISQWTAIGTSILNWVLIAKLLMQSRCYYLLDGNGIPPTYLRKLATPLTALCKATTPPCPTACWPPPWLRPGSTSPPCPTGRRPTT